MDPSSFAEAVAWLVAVYAAWQLAGWALEQWRHWRSRRRAQVAKDNVNWRAAAEALWTLLDDISVVDDGTADDGSLDSNAAFRRRVRVLVARRMRLLVMLDGQGFALSPGPDIPRKDGQDNG